MKESGREFRWEHDFRVHWREDFWQGSGQGQVGGGPRIPGDLEIKISVCPQPTPHCVCSLPPSTASVEEDSSQRAILCSVEISPPLTGMDTELTVVTAPARRSLRQLCSCSTAETWVYETWNPAPKSRNSEMEKCFHFLQQGKENKLHHLWLLSLFEFFLQINWHLEDVLK